MGRVAASPLAMLRWLEGNITSLGRSSIFRWPELDLSMLVPGRAFTTLRWPDVDFSVVDGVVWGFVVAIETVALVSTMCCYYILCGCSI